MIVRIIVLLFVVHLLAEFALSDSRASTLQEQAEFLAGIPLDKSSLLASFQSRGDYQKNQRELQADWAFCKRLRYATMQQWGRDHLSHDSSTRGVVRYLFGGPDFLNAHAFFPHARIMVLGGLEPVGEVPPPEILTPEAMAAGLKALHEALHTSLFCGYFITSEMKPQLLQGSFRGVLPVLMTELALTGNQILSIEMVSPFGSPGVRILYADFDPRADTQPQTLYYFQADLSNGSECKRFHSWLSSLGDGASYLKAASYLLPLPSFSETREFLLKTSSLILQDDSGIPFSAFQPNEWKIQLFGTYTDPLPVFKLHRDPLLDAAYHGGDYVGPLAFGVGYHVNGADANLLLASRLNGRAESIAYPSIITPMAEATPAPTSKPTPKPRTTRILIRKAMPVDGSDGMEVRPALPVESPILESPSVPATNSGDASPVVPAVLQNL